MPNTSNQNQRRTALRDLRILVTTLSLTVIIGLWNLFSRQAQQDLTESTVMVNAGPPPAGEDGLPPLPTLVPMDDALTTPAQIGEGNIPLREVTAPTPVIIQNRPPVVENVTIGQQPAADSGGNSGSGTNRPKPAANTGSSK